MRNIVRFALKNPVTISMIVFAILLLGKISYDRLSVDLLPDMNSPRLFVEFEAGERPPEEIEKMFVENMESMAIRQSDVTQVSSIVKAGSARITVEYVQKCKRGFATKREAAQWEQQFILQKKASMDMELESFCKLYEEDVRPRLKKSTWLTKENIIKSKILPYLGKRKVSEITAKDVLDWHNELRKLTSRKGKPLSPTYLKTIHGQLSTIFNHAIKFYDLSMNPARKAGTIGSEESKEMLFWTKAEYKQFSEEMMDKPLSYYAFQLLYWCGIRSGELLALTPADFDFQKRTLRINKSYQRLKGEDVISTPKTKNSVRTVTMPKFLCDEMQDCLKLYYSLQPDDRIFPVTKYYLNHEMERGCKASGVKKIRVHDLRHSHVSLLINMGYTALAIGKRVGHSAEKITYRYAHLFPSVQQDMADQLDAENMNEEPNDREGGLAYVS